MDYSSNAYLVLLGGWLVWSRGLAVNHFILCCVVVVRVLIVFRFACMHSSLPIYFLTVLRIYKQACVP